MNASNFGELRDRVNNWDYLAEESVNTIKFKLFNIVAQQTKKFF